MENSKIQQKMHPLFGYFAFLVTASLFVCKIAPVIFSFFFRVLNLENLAIICAFFESFLFISVYFIALFFISASYVAKPESYLVSFFRYDSFLSCIILFVAHYFVVFAILFLIYYFFRNSSDYLSLVPNEILFYLFVTFDLKLLFALSGFYLLPCYLVVKFPVATMVTHVFQLYIWNAKKSI